MSITVSLETAKKLKEAGFGINTVFNWQYNYVHNYEKNTEGNEWVLWNSEVKECKPPYEQQPHIVAAPTAEEILERLPSEITIRDKWRVLDICVIGKHWACGYIRGGCPWSRLEKNISLSEACAALWLWCKEAGYIK